MKCHSVNSEVSQYLEGRLPDRERQEVESHLQSCARCRSHYLQFGRLRTTLRGLPKRNPPQELTTSLRVLASRERVRQRSRSSITAILAHHFEDVGLRMNNLMRPLAIPFAGGLVSAVMLFSMLVPTMRTQSTTFTDDVPTALYTEASLKSIMPFALKEDEVVVDLIIDDQGRMVDYSFPHEEPHLLKDADLRRNIENKLLFTLFTPATTFGQPMQGKVRIYFRRTHIDVKG